MSHIPSRMPRTGDLVRTYGHNSRQVWTGIVIGKAGYRTLRVMWSDGDWVGEIEPELVEIIEESGRLS